MTRALNYDFNVCQFRSQVCTTNWLTGDSHSAGY